MTLCENQQQKSIPRFLVSVLLCYDNDDDDDYDDGDNDESSVIWNQKATSDRI